MKDQPNQTAGLPNRKTDSLEQLPSNKKRTLRTGQLASPFAEGTNQPAAKETAPAQSAPAPSAPAPSVPATPPPAPPLATAPRADNQTDMLEQQQSHTGQFGGKTSLIEASQATTNHVVMKAPEPKEPAPIVVSTPPPAPPVKSAPPEPPLEKTAPTEAVNLPPVAATKPATKPAAKAASAGDLPLFEAFEGYVDMPKVKEPRTVGGMIKSVVLGTIPIVILLAVAIGIAFYVPALREKLSAKLPVKFAMMLGLKAAPVPFVTVQADPIIYDEKEQTATLGGTVTNASEVAVGPVQLEFVLSRREDVRLTVAKLIDVEPNQLAPQTSAKYQFKISTKEFQDSKLARAINGQAAIKFKNLGVVEPAPATDTQPANLPANNGPKPKVDDDKIYDGSVSSK